MTSFTESVLEKAALAWLEGLSSAVKHGPEIAPGELEAERVDYGQVVLEDRLRQALARLSTMPPQGALADAVHKLARWRGVERGDAAEVRDEPGGTHAKR